MKVWHVAGVTGKELDNLIAEPARRLRAGDVIAFPTETVYGLGANAWDEDAVRKIFAAKGRPSDNPLIVHIAHESHLDGVVPNPSAIPEPARRLMKAFWPGPLTLILPAHEKLASSVHPGTDTVGVRMPHHPVAQALIAAAGCPVAAPSANSSGRPSPTTAETVAHDLADYIDGLIDGGPCDVGLESTVVAVTESEGVVYRPGWITPEELADAAGVPFRLDPHLEGGAEAPRSPGMKYRHYAPDAKVSVWWGDARAVAEAVREFVLAAGDNAAQSSAASAASAPSATEPTHPRLALICPADFAEIEGITERWSPGTDEPYETGLSRELYTRLRWGDEVGADAVLIVGVPPTGHGLALMNRLQKASEGRLFHV
ncbi:threonylcarbamoyl-AMP synthase [Alicyclobacillus curvatus]|nr:threonylcarbamoyl-AMP synthase [Alicyclobacillus curvatus]